MAIDPQAADYNVSPELNEVLFKTALVNEYREKEFQLSFTSVLLGFITSRTPMGQWLAKYITSNKIDVDDMMSSRNVTPDILERISYAEMPSEPRELRQTVSVRSLFEAATGFQRRVSGANFGGTGLLADYAAKSDQLGERHLLAAYIYEPGSGHEQQLIDWNFNREHWSESFLAEIDARNKNELPMWISIHEETFGNKPKLPKEEKVKDAEEHTVTDQTRVLLDGASNEDMLGRKFLAEALATRMTNTWERYRNEKIKGSFLLHIHGAWGSGKSSLLNFLRTELQPRDLEQLPELKKKVVTKDEVDWIVVDFNAWQRQRVEPPWWSLIDTIYTQSRTQLKKKFGRHWRALYLLIRERWWRFTTGRRDHFIAMIISFLFLAAVLIWRRLWPNSGSSFDLKSAAAVLALIGGLWSTLLVLGRSLLSGSSQSAQAFMQRSGDPMERVSEHFIHLMTWIDMPVAIFVDDLDRCQTEYVVNLLEGIQTLFNNPRATYVIAADRRWLHVSFEKLYDNFKEAVNEPGRRLGSLFLEKAFEASISVPRMSPERKTVYWDNVGAGARPTVAELEQATAQVQSEFANVKTEAEVFTRLNDAAANPMVQELRKGAALRQLAKQEVAKTTDYFLKPFVHLTEPNPRAMKRLVNAYTFLRDMALLGNSDLSFTKNVRKQLVLWAIVSLRWPLLKEQLEDYLEEHADDEVDIVELICQGESVPDFSPELNQLVKTREVRRVFKGEGIGTKLERDTICSFVGISAGTPRSGGVH
jgi:signal transduction histidine kinase